MEQRGNAQNHQIPHHGPPYQANQMPPRPLIPAPHHHQHLPNPPPPQQTELDHQLRQFWADQLQEASSATDFKTHALPLARIKKIMKSDDDVKMVSSEAPVLLAKACEMFISELTLRSWSHTVENKRRVIQKHDVIAALAKTDLFDFLVDTIPRDEFKGEEVQSKLGGGGGGGGGGGDCLQLPGEGASYYYVPAPPLPPPFVGNYPMNQMVDVQQAAAQGYVAMPMWPQQSPPPPPPQAEDPHKEG